MTYANLWHDSITAFTCHYDKFQIAPLPQNNKRKPGVHDGDARVLTNDIVLRTEGVNYSLIPVTSEPLNNDLHDNRRYSEHTGHNRIPLTIYSRGFRNSP